MEFANSAFAAGVRLNDRYDVLSHLNNGSFGVVVLAYDRHSRRKVAIKCLNKVASTDGQPSLQVDDRSEELQIHSRIGNQPNIVNLLDSFGTDTHTFIVLEYCIMGDLYEAIRQGKGPKETEHVRAFMLQLVQAVECLHVKGIYHRDIKPENIFLTEKGKMKLGDFGLATTDAWSTEIAVGSDRYMAPEQYDPAGCGISPARADIWSIGICLLNILFSRNPFAVPSTSDPLFEDFVRDRQSLFDVFPNMHDDTFEVLNYCLQVDPGKRSLTKLKDALQRVVCFTTDEESLDDYCTELRDSVKTTANREPLRTPSITSPNMTGTDYPWSRLSQVTSPKGRQLSVIPDTVSEDLFAQSENSGQSWFSKADTRSIESTVDSGFGMSVDDSPESATSRTRPVPIAFSMPTFGRASSTFQSLFGKKKSGFEAKSWSDLQDEEDEEMAAQAERQKASSKLSTLSQADSEEDGRSTPRAILTTDNEPRSTSNESQMSKADKDDDDVSHETGFVFEEHLTSTSTAADEATPTKRSFITDKWAALGDRRRGGSQAIAVPSRSSKVSTPAPDNDASKRRFSRPSSWRRPSWKKGFGSHSLQNPSQLSSSNHNIWQQKEWNVSKDWRRPEQIRSGSPLKPHESQLDGAAVLDYSSSDEDDFVGGWNSLHL